MFETKKDVPLGAPLKHMRYSNQSNGMKCVLPRFSRHLRHSETAVGNNYEVNVNECYM